jgi:hypothetical protein
MSIMATIRQKQPAARTQLRDLHPHAMHWYLKKNSPPQSNSMGCSLFKSGQQDGY